MDKFETHNIQVLKEQKTESITFKQLYEEMLSEIELYENLGKLDELMNQKVVVSLYDSAGRVVSADLNDLIGWLEQGNVLLNGQITGVYF
ncbi:hypothetical protein [Paenibacillus illinoisensis]|uniref:Uncharacterized protein n=1 Tax=Paenibacillus illinoisensis TaxID=59845 RepID=A0A2W0C662_9BACL|nr:hypothetical protein [Paenibacillus illinoisensis]PYY28203.1 hypothetical protein PIL02S_03349 [Paenibacillus illinoisensis]